MTKEERQGVLSSSILAVLVKFIVFAVAVSFMNAAQLCPIEDMRTLPKMAIPYIVHNVSPHIVCITAIGFQYVKLDQMRIYLRRELFNFD